MHYHMVENSGVEIMWNQFHEIILSGQIIVNQEMIVQ